MIEVSIHRVKHITVERIPFRNNGPGHTFDLIRVLVEAESDTLEVNIYVKEGEKVGLADAPDAGRP